MIISVAKCACECNCGFVIVSEMGSLRPVLFLEYHPRPKIRGSGLASKTTGLGFSFDALASIVTCNKCGKKLKLC